MRNSFVSNPMLKPNSNWSGDVWMFVKWARKNLPGFDPYRPNVRFLSCPVWLRVSRLELTCPGGIAHGHAGSDVLLDAVLREGVTQAVLGERLHTGDRFGDIVGRQRHQHFVVEHAAIAALREARDR